MDRNVLGIVPLNRAARAGLVDGFDPITSASRNDRVADHSESMARSVEQVEHAATGSAAK